MNRIISYLCGVNFLLLQVAVTHIQNGLSEPKNNSGILKNKLDFIDLNQAGRAAEAALPAVFSAVFPPKSFAVSWKSVTFAALIQKSWYYEHKRRNQERKRDNER